MVHIVHTASQRNSKFKPQVSATGKERIEETTSLTYTKVKPRKDHLERMCSPPTLVDFPSVSLVLTSSPTVLSREHTRWGQDSHVLGVSCSPTVRNIKALAPSLLVPTFCPGEGCHLLTHHIEIATYIHWDLLLKLKSDSQEPTSLGKCSNLRDKLLPPWLTNENN